MSRALMKGFIRVERRVTVCMNVDIEGQDVYTYFEWTVATAAIFVQIGFISSQCV